MLKSATEANKSTLKRIEEIKIAELTKIANLIDRAIDEGNFYITLNYGLTKEVKDILSLKGYQVTVTNSLNEFITTIKWGE